MTNTVIQAIDRKAATGARKLCNFILSKVLAANVAKSFTVPTGATEVLFAASGDFHLQFFTAASGADVTLNGAFATDTVWTKGTGWTIAAGVATATGAISTNLSETPTTPLIPGQAYLVSFDATQSAGAVNVQIGGTNGTARSTSATFSEVIVAGVGTDIVFVAAGFSGTIDNVTVTPVAAVPGDNTTGNAPTMVKSTDPENEGRTFQIPANVATISVVSPATNTVTASFFQS